MNNKLTVVEAVQRYVQLISSTRSPHTARAYQNGLVAFLNALTDRKMNPETTMANNLSEDAIAWFADGLKSQSPSTERLYLTAAKGLFEYLASEQLASVNLPRLNLLIKHRARRPGIRLPQFHHGNIAILLKYAINIVDLPFENDLEQLRNLRDRAFILTLADTGMRVHEACNLRRGEIDSLEGKAVIIGKGNQEAVIRFSKRSIRAINDYLAGRASVDGATGKPLGALPVFARHDKGAGQKVLPMTTTTGRNILSERVREALGPEAVHTITPHSLRHYFVTTILKASGNLKLAQELARHKNIAVTQRYAHLSNDELDQGYHDIFENG
jgi:integrase/recombinase XerC